MVTTPYSSQPEGPGSMSDTEQSTATTDVGENPTPLGPEDRAKIRELLTRSSMTPPGAETQPTPSSGQAPQPQEQVLPGLGAPFDNVMQIIRMEEAVATQMASASTIPEIARDPFKANVMRLLIIIIRLLAYIASSDLRKQNQRKEHAAESHKGKNKNK